MKKLMICAMALTMFAAVGCKGKKAAAEKSEIEQKVAEYAEFELTSDLIGNLSDSRTGAPDGDGALRGGSQAC